ncbi:hypothetical protein LTR16_000202 [Cryomyces antarcticus]|uniref:Uncharacterized protein n=1 Tax=Cryomyces antarcticus TaxID=329879 RepID=A0ABR0KUX5_9PEZI|nr:hypothetical protein LTR39_000420 [Cryomyces antarcticus]KAK5021058.1 hypothetical protein LTR60_000137 [Cryomyces antarcticus]KAK5131981.1 hypothetical protein LTR16_000202 [Cryomyces antarcticus]
MDGFTEKDIAAANSLLALAAGDSSAGDAAAQATDVVMGNTEDLDEEDIDAANILLSMANSDALAAPAAAAAATTVALATGTTNTAEATASNAIVTAPTLAAMATGPATATPQAGVATGPATQAAATVGDPWAGDRKDGKIAWADAEMQFLIDLYQADPLRTGTNAYAAFNARFLGDAAINKGLGRSHSAVLNQIRKSSVINAIRDAARP